MTVYEVTCYAIRCDERGCDETTETINPEYSGWVDEESAVLDWTGGGEVGCWEDNQITAEGKHYCSKHIKPECADGCGRAEGLINDADDESGDWWCPEHLETFPEYEAPGVVV